MVSGKLRGDKRLLVIKQEGINSPVKVNQTLPTTYPARKSHVLSKESPS